MLPENVLSSSVVSGSFLYPRNIPKSPLFDYEMGGLDIEDSSAGLRVKAWRGQVIENSIVLDADAVPPVTIITVPEIREFSFTFDQSMRPFITYVLENDEAYYYWYDTTIPGYRTTQLAAGTSSPRCAIDDNRNSQAGASDIILAYVRGFRLYFRAQRDRYLIEYAPAPDTGFRRLAQIGMSNKNRFQFLGIP